MAVDARCAVLPQHWVNHAGPVPLDDSVPTANVGPVGWDLRQLVGTVEDVHAEDLVEQETLDHTCDPVTHSSGPRNDNLKDEVPREEPVRRLVGTAPVGTEDGGEAFPECLPPDILFLRSVCAHFSVKRAVAERVDVCGDVGDWTGLRARAIALSPTVGGLGLQWFSDDLTASDKSVNSSGILGIKFVE